MGEAQRVQRRSQGRCHLWPMGPGGMCRVARAKRLPEQAELAGDALEDSMLSKVYTIDVLELDQHGGPVPQTEGAGGTWGHRSKRLVAAAGHNGRIAVFGFEDGAEAEDSEAEEQPRDDKDDSLLLSWKGGWISPVQFLSMQPTVCNGPSAALVRGRERGGAWISQVQFLLHAAHGMHGTQCCFGSGQSGGWGGAGFRKCSVCPRSPRYGRDLVLLWFRALPL